MAYYAGKNIELTGKNHYIYNWYKMGLLGKLKGLRYKGVLDDFK